MDTQHETEVEYRPAPWRKLLGSIWTRPAETARTLFTEWPDLFQHRLMILFGMSALVMLSMPGWLYTGPHPVGLMIKLLVMGPVGGLMIGYIFSAVLRNIVVWQGGRTERSRMRTLVSWGNLPFILGFYAAALSYALMWSLRDATNFDGWILFEGIAGYVPLGVFALFWIWGILNRVAMLQATTGLSRADSLKALLISQAIFYGPMTALLLTYYFITVTSLSALQTV